MATIKGPGKSEIYDGLGLRIAIVHARWNTPIIEALVAGAKKTMLAAGVTEENIVTQSVPGSYELPYAVQRICSAPHAQAPSRSTSACPTSATTNLGNDSVASMAPFDAIVAIGVLIKGETMHFEYIADAVTHGLMRVQLDAGVPVIFGLLTVLNEAQGYARAGLGSGQTHNHGEDWGRAAVELSVKQRGWAEGRIVRGERD